MAVSSLNALVKSSVLKSESGGGGGGGGGVDPDAPLTLNDSLTVGTTLTVTGNVAFNGREPQPPTTVSGAAADGDQALIMVNVLRTALINTGIVVVSEG
jgi:hypothetical protein